MARFKSIELFRVNGVHAIVDGQFGSAGKGALAAWLAEQMVKEDRNVEGCIYSGGPNSGHTFYHEGAKHVLKQVPTTAVALCLLTGHPSSVYLSAGAIIDPEILFDEARRYPQLRIFVDPNATVVLEEDKAEEHRGSISEVAGTRSGAGAALVRKIRREPKAIWRDHKFTNLPSNVVTRSHNLHPDEYFYFMEVSQGFSLGINSHFYPKVTSRECTVMQGLADVRIPPRSLARTYMAIRTFPIRVGNVDGFSSGDWYIDQEELTWADLGVEPELTTVTKRERRIATFSDIQFEDAVRANDPDFVFINFLNYLTPEAQYDFIENIRGKLEHRRIDLIGGYGPTSADIRLL